MQAVSARNVARTRSTVRTQHAAPVSAPVLAPVTHPSTCKIVTNNIAAPESTPCAPQPAKNGLESAPRDAARGIGDSARAGEGQQHNARQFKHDRGDWMLNPAIFHCIQGAFTSVGLPLVLDCACRSDRANAHLKHACTPHHRSYLDPASRAWVRGHRGIWCNPPFGRLAPFARAYAADVAAGCYGAFVAPSWRSAEVATTLSSVATLVGIWEAGIDIFRALERCQGGVAYVNKGPPAWSSELWISLPNKTISRRVSALIRRSFGNTHLEGGSQDPAVRAAWVPRSHEGIAWTDPVESCTPSRNLSI